MVVRRLDAFQRHKGPQRAFQFEQVLAHVARLHLSQRGACAQQSVDLAAEWFYGGLKPSATERAVAYARPQTKQLLDLSQQG
jgi:hypothetical protein